MRHELNVAIELVRFIVTILTTAIERFDAMISTFAGFLLTVAIAVFNFFVGYKVALLVFATIITECIILM